MRKSKKIVALVEIKSEENGRDYKAEILQKLSNSLPEYMVPSDIKVVASIPLNQNGKADKKLLEQIYLQRR